MGWWTQNKQGHSFAINEDVEMYWGDAAADIMDNAIDEIVQQFELNWGRRPTKDEMRAGLEFSLGGSDEVGRPRPERHQGGDAQPARP
jgi:hypothetical protein